MVVETKEQVEPVAEQERTSTSEAEPEEKTEVSKESEDKEVEGAPKLSEEAKQQIIAEEYAKWQSKTLTPIVKKSENLEKQVADLNAQLEDRSDDRRYDLLLKGDIEDLGEDEAKRLDEERRGFKAELRDHKVNSKSVKEAAEIAKGLAAEFTDEVAAKLGFGDKTIVGILKAAHNVLRLIGDNNRYNMAKERAYKIIMPQDKKFDAVIQSIISELVPATSEKEMDRLEAIIIRERSGNKKPFTPDSGKVSGGGGVDISKMSPDQKIEYGLNKPKRT